MDSASLSYDWHFLEIITGKTQQALCTRKSLLLPRVVNMMHDDIYSGIVCSSNETSRKENITDFHVIMSTYNQSTQRARYGEWRKWQMERGEKESS
jgi:hypothetical protein